jgi:type I restriction enzyme S subunit
VDLRPDLVPGNLGINPEGWEFTTLGELGATFGGLSGKAKRDFGHGAARYITFMNVMANVIIDIGRLERVDVKPQETQNPLAKGDLLFNGSSETPGEVGLCAVLTDDVQGVFLNSFCFGLRLRQGGRADGLYLAYFFRSREGRELVRSLAQGAIRYNLSKTALLKIPFPLPPPTEQSAIAGALSDVDALIESLEQLLLKKRYIKQGAMQDLLTGQKRLPGFSREWQEKRLGNTASLKARIGWQGLTTAEYLDSGNYYLVTGTEFNDGRVDWSSCHYVDKSRFDQDRYIQLKVNDVLVTKDGTIGKVAFVADLPGPATLNSGVFVIRPADHAFLPEFFFQLLRSNLFDEFLSQLSAGSTINHLYQKDFVDFVYRTPTALGEQQAIGAILSDMDAEIAELEAKGAKARQIKQGMLEELLTGRVRLV